MLNNKKYETNKKLIKYSFIVNTIYCVFLVKHYYNLLYNKYIYIIITQCIMTVKKKLVTL